jgi:uncharacterized protein (DUF1330 family)
LPVERLAVIEFPSYEKAMRWWNSSEYREAKELRQSLSSAEILLVDGVA